MDRALIYGAAGLAGLVGLAYMRQARALENAAPETAPTDAETQTMIDQASQPDMIDQALSVADTVNPFAIMDRATVDAASQADNVGAFLSMIAHAEGTDRQADPYRVCYAYRHTVQSFDNHPALTGEWSGEPLDKLGASYAGKVSTAAGRYQIIRPTWRGCQTALKLPDFSPASQDLAAVYIVRQAGALDAVRAGEFDQAVKLCAGQWASLPGANAPGQAMRKLDDLRAFYVDAGGALA